MCHKRGWGGLINLYDLEKSEVGCILNLVGFLLGVIATALG